MNEASPEAFFQRLAENSPIGIYLVQDGKFRYVNREFENSTEFKRRDLIGRNCLSLVHPLDHEMVRGAAIDMLKGRRSVPYEYRVITSSGKTIWILETVTSLVYSNGPAAAGNFMNITERKTMEEKLRDQARRDSLTGLLNHGAILQELDDLLGRVADRQHAVILADIRGMKQVNDHHGHLAGDAVLTSAADALDIEGAIVGRYDGDEFVAILPGCNLAQAAEYSARVCASLKDFQITDAGGSTIASPGLTLGVAIYPTNGSLVDQLIAAADNDMYAQRRGAAA